MKEHVLGGAAALIVFVALSACTLTNDNSRPSPPPMLTAPARSPVPAPSSSSVFPTASRTPTACTYRGSAAAALPDPICTPGAVNPDVTQANIAGTICRSGWTTGVRPPTSFTSALKLRQMRLYGDVDARGNLLSPAGFEEDHLIPLELGGNPEDPRNLWPQPGPVPNPKDDIENALHELVCLPDGNPRRMLLAVAQQRIARDWTVALP